jgi:hypothetical protein
MRSKSSKRALLQSNWKNTWRNSQSHPMPRFDIYKNPNPKASHAFYLDIHSDLVTTATRSNAPRHDKQPLSRPHHRKSRP